MIASYTSDAPTGAKSRPHTGGRPPRPFYQDNIEPLVQVLAVDWLELSFLVEEQDFVSGADRIERGRFVFTKWSHGSKCWTYLYNVTYKGDPWGVFKCVPRKGNKILKENEVHLKLDNAVCYTDWYDSVLAFERNVGIFSHITRLDIAADGKNILHPLNLTMNGKIRRVSKGNSTMYNKAHVSYKSHDSGVYCDYFRLGSPQSEKFMRVYNKSKELKQSGKQYIHNYWKINGITDTSQMERAELTLRAMFTRQIFEKDYICKKLSDVVLRLMDKQTLVEIMEKYVSGLYEFKLRDKVHVSQCKSAYKLFNIISLTHLTWRALKFLSTVHKAATEGIYSTKLTLKKLVQLSWKTRNSKFFRLASEIAHNSHLTSYFNENRKKWVSEYDRLAFRCGLPRSLPFLEFFKLKQDNVVVQPVHDYTRVGAAGVIEREIEHLQLMKLHLA